MNHSNTPDIIINDIYIFENPEKKDNKILNNIIKFLINKNYNDLKYYDQFIKNNKKYYEKYTDDIQNSSNNNYNQCILAIKKTHCLCNKMNIEYINPDILYDYVFYALRKMHNNNYIYKEINGIDILNKR